MRSLFVKIFLWFWLANTLVVGVLVLMTVDAPSGPHRARMRAFIDHMIMLNGEKAVATLERDGSDALRQQLDNLEHTIGVRLFLYDEKGEESLLQSAPATAKELALQAAQSADTELDRIGTTPMAARRVNGSDGKTYVVVAQLPSGPMSQMFRSPTVWLLRVCAVVLMAGVMCYGMGRYLTGPVRRLRASAQQLADGNLNVRVGAAVGRRRDEFGDLGRDFDHMAERIEMLVSTQRTLLRDMSHELRSPLARLQVALGLARRQTEPQVGATLDRIEREVERLNELIGGLLTLARLETGEATRRKATIDLASLIRDIAEDAAFEAQGCNRQVRLLHCDECSMVGTPELLHSAIENVVRNGIRYTAEGSPVDITVVRERDGGESRAVVRVRDRGPGVPEDLLEAIFRPFHRVDNDRNRHTGGVGLGLAIARQAVRLHGGAVSASNARDGGLCVTFCLPLSSTIDDVQVSPFD